MKVNIYETVEVSNEQREQIARLLDGPEAKKRQATRDELKTFIWEAGSDWEAELEQHSRDGQPDEDLLGDAPGDDEDLI